MGTVIVLCIGAAYLFGAAWVVRWGAEKSGAEKPGWWDTVGMLLLPAAVGKVTRWAIPDAWDWPERSVAAVLGALTFLVVLRYYFRLGVGYTVAAFFLIYGLALLVILALLPIILKESATGSRNPGRNAPAVEQHE